MFPVDVVKGMPLKKFIYHGLKDYMAQLLADQELNKSWIGCVMLPSRLLVTLLLSFFQGYLMCLSFTLLGTRVEQY